MTPMSDHAVTISLQLRWGDMDINSHINNVAIARLLEESRVRAMPRLISSGPAAPITDDATATGTGLVVVRQEVEFLATIPYSEDDIVASVWLSRVGGSSFEFGSVLADSAGRRFVQAETTLVCVDPTGAPTALPENLATAMRDRLDEPVALRSRTASRA